MEIKHQITKTLVTRDNTRSSDAIAPNFIYGCLGGCMNTYCYVGRFNNNKVYINDNLDQILGSINTWSDTKVFPKVANQVDSKYYCIDIGCSTDVPLHSKFYDWQKVFDYFNDHPKLKSTFATKYPTKFNLDKYTLNPEKHRIRISLMPQRVSDILEPNTDKIIDRINSIENLEKHLEVHINFSPIIYYKKWLEDYEELFILLKAKNHSLKCECIFLTYNENQAKTQTGLAKLLLYNPEIQESKNSQYAADNLRYKWQLKYKLVSEFKELYSKYFPIENIRYIF